MNNVHIQGTIMSISERQGTGKYGPYEILKMTVGVVTSTRTTDVLNEVPVTYFNPSTELKDQLLVGTEVDVKAMVQVSRWTTEAGVERLYPEVVASRVVVLEEAPAVAVAVTA